MSIGNIFFRSPVEKAVASIKRREGQRIRDWIDLFGCLRESGRLSPDVVHLMESHEIDRVGHAVNHYASEIVSVSGTELRALAKQVCRENVETIATKVVAIVVQKKSIFQCRDSHTEGLYYAHAEPEMEWQWDLLIAPYIGDADLSAVLELAPGHGRNSAKLLQQGAQALHLVDVNQTCIDACRARFGGRNGDCQLFFHVTGGDTLPFIEDKSISFVYSFDSMVHFDKTIVRAYLAEFARVMWPGGTGFLHHSNLGAFQPNSDWAKNHGNRSDMSAALFRKYCDEVGLEVTRQVMHGVAEGRGMDDLDCVSLIRKP